MDAYKRLPATLLSAFIGFSCASCGVVTPEIQEFWADENDHQIAVNAIVGQISCEIGQAVRSVYYSDRHRGDLNFLNQWGAQFSLILTADEKTALSPGATFITPLASMQKYSTSIGGVFSSEGNRIDTQQRLYPISDFLKGGPRYKDGKTDGSCLQSIGEPGTLFVQTDSGFRDDLYSFVATLWTREADVPLSSQTSAVVGMSHNIKFDIVTSGNITPTWTLTKFVASASPLFNASRDRSQQFIITLGPLAKDAGKSKSLQPSAQNSHNSQELAGYISRALISN